MAKKKKFASNPQEHNMVKKIDQIAEFEEFCREILPALRQDLANSHMTAETLAKKYEVLAEARRITMIATSENESAVIAAIKDLRDRVSGKPKETKTLEHKFAHLSDEELTSVVESEKLTLKEMTEGSDDD